MKPPQRRQYAPGFPGATVSRKGMEKQLVHGEDNLGNVGSLL